MFKGEHKSFTRAENNHKQRDIDTFKENKTNPGA